MVYYIDPGTGSMLFTILIGVLSAGVYAIKNLIIKLRFLTSSGNVNTVKTNAIPLVIFSDDKRYLGVFEPICDEFERRGADVVYMTASPDDPLLEKQYEHVKCQFIGEGNRAFAKLNMLKADIVLSTTPGLDVYQWKRSREVKYYVHIVHQISDVTIYHMFGIDYYDAILVSGEYEIDQVRQLEALRKLPEKEVVVVGQPYMDTLWAKKEAMTEKPHEGTTVLLAPSWGDSAIFKKYGGKIIDELLKTGYHIIIRPHPQSFKSEIDLMDKLMKEYPESDQLEWNRDTDNFDVLSRSDILISDFSAVMFDFTLIFDRPIIYSASDFDKSPYDAYWLSEDPWTLRSLPKLGRELKAEDLQSLKQVIDGCLTSETFAENREIARSETWANIGESAKLTVDYLLKKQAELKGEGGASD
ncbi:MAG: CDP-glycerol glycerophosphotransferase family protein [Clostridia bacterium]|nr:CDP-glycerol glycerophosphotransferase family protein [Clostridia bacterium]